MEWKKLQLTSFIKTENLIRNEYYDIKNSTNIVDESSSIATTHKKKDADLALWM